MLIRLSITKLCKSVIHIIFNPLKKVSKRDNKEQLSAIVR